MGNWAVFVKIGDDPEEKLDLIDVKDIMEVIEIALLKEKVKKAVKV